MPFAMVPFLIGFGKPVFDRFDRNLRIGTNDLLGWRLSSGESSCRDKARIDVVVVMT